MGFLGIPVVNVYQSVLPTDLGWRYMGMTPSLAASSANLIGTSTSPTEGGTVANVAATSTALAAKSYTTSTTLNNIASWTVDPIHNYSNTIAASFCIGLDAITNRRVMVGFADAAPATMGASDTPSQNFVGFRFSTNASDVNWKGITDNASGSPTVVDTGSIVGASSVLLSFVSTSTGVVIFFVNGVIVGVSTAKLPSTGVNTLRPFVSITNLSGGTTRQVIAYFMNMRSKVV